MMNTIINAKYVGIALALASCVACGSDHAHSGPSQSQGEIGSNSSASTLSPAQSGNVVSDGTVVVVNSNIAGGATGAAQVKCIDVNNNGVYHASCSCSTDGNRTCPIYGDSNSEAVVNSTFAFQCGTRAVSGGYLYGCDCDTTSDSNVSGSCSLPYNPADPNAVAMPFAEPATTCQSMYPCYRIWHD